MQQSALRWHRNEMGEFEVTEVTSFTKSSGYQTYTNVYHSFIINIKVQEQARTYVPHWVALNVQTL